MKTEFDVIVVGAGMWGSAATRHLAHMGADVAVIGPFEPKDRQSYQGPYASHHDQARITRRLATDRDWSRLSTASIARYAALEADTGISFYSEAGGLMGVAADHADAASVTDRIKAVDEAEAIGAEPCTGAALRNRLPIISYPDDALVFAERKNSGFIDPRAHVRAQLAAAKASGATHFETYALRVSEAPGEVSVTLANGVTLRAQTVVVAAGGYTNDRALTPEPVPLTVYARTIALFEVDAEEQDRLRAMPSMIYYLPAPDDSLYVLPPVTYPDGKSYIKIGGEPKDRTLKSTAEINAWFHTGGSAEVGAYLKVHLEALLPGLRAQSMHTAACITSFSPSGKPLIYHQTDRIMVLAAGNGAGAKNADEIGRLGALRALGQSLSNEGYATDFQP